MEYRNPVMGEEILLRRSKFYLDEDGTKVYWETCHIDRIEGNMVGVSERPWQKILWTYAYEDHLNLLEMKEEYKIKKEKYERLKKKGNLKVRK